MCFFVIRVMNASRTRNDTPGVVELVSKLKYPWTNAYTARPPSRAAGFSCRFYSRAPGSSALSPCVPAVVIRLLQRANARTGLENTHVKGKEEEARAR